MTIHAYRYQNDDQTMYFRGYVQWYEGIKRIRAACMDVQKTEGDALRDAKRLLKAIKSENETKHTV